MIKLIIHLGHGKTGTTAFQHFCVNNSKSITDAGWLYYELSEESDLFQALLSGSPEEIYSSTRSITAGLSCPDLSILASSEELFWAIHDIAPKLHPSRHDIDFTFLLVTRDPYEMIEKAYCQHVKSLNLNLRFKVYLDSSNVLEVSHLMQSARAITALTSAGFAVQVANYSHIKTDLITSLLVLAGIKDAEITRAAKQSRAIIINKSLSISQADTIAQINKLLGPEFGAFVARKVLNMPAFNEKNSKSFPLSEREISAYSEIFSPFIEIINYFLDANSKLCILPPTAGEDIREELSPDSQLAIPVQIQEFLLEYWSSSNATHSNPLPSFQQHEIAPNNANQKKSIQLRDVTLNLKRIAKGHIK